MLPCERYARAFLWEFVMDVYTHMIHGRIVKTISSQ